MTAAPIALTHPLLSGVGDLESALAGMSIDGWDGVEESELAGAATRLMRVTARVAAHQAALARVIDESGLAKRSGASSTGAMLAASFGGDRAAGDRMARAGRRLAEADVVARGQADGRLSERQAQVIARATSSLPPGTTPAQREQCQRTLVADAQKLTAKDLQRRAGRITDTFKAKPEVDDHENEHLADREKRAWDKAEFVDWDNGDGTRSGRYTVPEAAGDTLRAAIEALAAPRREHLGEHPEPGRPTPQRMGRAFAELCAHLSAETVADGAPTLVVHLDFETLTGAAIAGTLSTGTRMSAEEVRLTACRAEIIPVVMGGASVPLDLGRQRRLFTKAQKIAMGVRDRGCAFPGCDRPPQWCEAHHWRKPWAHGGRTDVADGVLLCAHHHRTVHHQDWFLKAADDGTIEFRAPGTTVWQRNHRWRP
jgi:hypothetical protein